MTVPNMFIICTQTDSSSDCEADLPQCTRITETNFIKYISNRLLGMGRLVDSLDFQQDN